VGVKGGNKGHSVKLRILTLNEGELKKKGDIVRLTVGKQGMAGRPTSGMVFGNIMVGFKNRVMGFNRESHLTSDHCAKVRSKQPKNSWSKTSGK